MGCGHILHHGLACNNFRQGVVSFFSFRYPQSHLDKMYVAVGVSFTLVVKGTSDQFISVRENFILS